MSFAERFEDLEIWQRARTLNQQVYKALQTCKDYSFRDQMQRAALSVMNNISEGFERRTKKDFAHFLDLAKGSAGEVRSMTFAAEDIEILNVTAAQRLRVSYEMLSRQIASFQKHLRA
ncbi:MAG: four helix bundle protein [Chthoniobacterales bacterium]|nr:four helix bundle protein [Chthoniobacterales bacterium]